MKRRIMALLMAACMIFGLTACGGGEDNKPTVTLRFASWNVGTEEENNLERQMIAAFEKANPHIDIVIADDIAANDWNGSLTTAAAGGTLPDVAFIAELPIAVANEWALDVTELAKNDPEWAQVPDSLIESGMYNGKLFGIPTAMHLAGLFMNTDYFDEANVDPLEYGYTYDEFVKTVEKLHNPSAGKVAIAAAHDFINFLPYVWDNTQGWFTYDGTSMHLNSDAFIKAVKETGKLTEYSWGKLSDDQKAQSVGAEAGDEQARNEGHAGVFYGFSYSCEGYVRDVKGTVEYVGLPGGASVIIPDYCFISSTTQHPQEAWEFVKFMYWGTEGTKAKMDIDEADDNVAWVSLPVIADDAILDRYFDNFPVEGVEEAYKGLTENGSIVEAFKFAPGYNKARWNGATGITDAEGVDLRITQVLDKCVAGEMSINDICEELNKASNKFIEEARKAIDEVTK